MNGFLRSSQLHRRAYGVPVCDLVSKYYLPWRGAYERRKGS